MRRPLMLSTLLLVAVTACTLGEKPPEPETVPPSPTLATFAQLEELQQQVDTLRAYLGAVNADVEALKPLEVRFTILERQLAKPPKLEPKRKGAAQPVRQPRELTIPQLITIADKNAQARLNEDNFFGNSATLTYTWEPDRLFPIPLSWNSGTPISLPVGEKLLNGFLLDKEQFTVLTERTGSEPLTQDTISIKPKIEQGEIKTYALTESGKKFLFLLVIGTKGATSVTFQTRPIATMSHREPPLVLPNPKARGSQ